MNLFNFKGTRHNYSNNYNRFRTTSFGSTKSINSHRNGCSRPYHDSSCCVNKNNLELFKDRKLVLITSKTRGPISIFSTIPVNNKHRNYYHSRTDSTKEHFNSINKRNTRYISGSRQLSTITDGEPPNLLTQLGLDTIEEEISFSHLLNDNDKKYRPNNISEAIAYNNSLVMNRLTNITSRNLLPDQFSTSPMNTGTSPISDSVMSLPNTPELSNSTVNWSYFATAAPSFLKELVYHPYLLDDPELIAGKHSTMLGFSSFVVRIFFNLF